MTKRTFWSKLNHDDARLSIDMMDDAEVGRWFRGWLAGAGGKEYPDEKIQSWPLEMRTGFAAGKESFADAEQYSQKQRDRINKRYHGSTTEHHGSTTVDSGKEIATGSLPSNSQQLTASNQQQEENSEKPKSRAKARATFDRTMHNCLLTGRFTSDAEFIELWESFVQDRKDRGKLVTAIAAKSIINKLEGYNLGVGKEALRKSIQSGWSGVFPESVDISRIQKPQQPIVNQENAERARILHERYKNERPF